MADNGAPLPNAFPRPRPRGSPALIARNGKYPPRLCRASAGGTPISARGGHKGQLADRLRPASARASPPWRMASATTGADTVVIVLSEFRPPPSMRMAMPAPITGPWQCDLGPRAGPVARAAGSMVNGPASRPPPSTRAATLAVDDRLPQRAASPRWLGPPICASPTRALTEVFPRLHPGTLRFGRKSSA